MDPDVAERLYILMASLRIRNERSDNKQAGCFEEKNGVLFHRSRDRPKRVVICESEKTRLVLMGPFRIKYHRSAILGDSESYPPVIYSGTPL